MNNQKIALERWKEASSATSCFPTARTSSLKLPMRMVMRAAQCDGDAGGSGTATDRARCAFLR
eukprot:5381017-Amphidinium_carterae.1